MNNINISTTAITTSTNNFEEELKTYLANVASLKSVYSSVQNEYLNLEVVEETYQAMYGLLSTLSDNSASTVFRFHTKNHFELLLYMTDRLHDLLLGFANCRRSQSRLISRKFAIVTKVTSKTTFYNVVFTIYVISFRWRTEQKVFVLKSN